MLGLISERECQTPYLGRTGEIQNYLHGGANAHDPFTVMETIVVCPELVAALRSARAVVWVKTLANHIEVTETLILWKNYRLCGHKSKPLVVSGVPAACPVACTHDRNSRRSFRYADLQAHPGNSTILERGSKPG